MERPEGDQLAEELTEWLTANPPRWPTDGLFEGLDALHASFPETIHTLLALIGIASLREDPDSFKALADSFFFIWDEMKRGGLKPLG